MLAALKECAPSVHEVFNNKTYSDLATTFQTKAKTAQEVYDFVWGKHLTEAEYEDRPLSKLTKDILDQLEIKR